MDWYAAIKTVHILAVISWMAGLFYLPRLFVYHSERGGDLHEEPVKSFVIMEDKLYRVIMHPAMYVSWVCGLLLVWLLAPSITDIWIWTKAASIIGMTWFHLWLGREKDRLSANDSPKSGRYYRLMNEVPTVLMIVIVASVIFKF